MYVFLIALYLVIVVHEFAHFIVAKAVKCKVEEFGIGFGRAIWQKKIGETVYRLNWFPMGGYNKLKDEVTYSRSKYAFTNLSYSKKMAITVAGCGANILFGIIGVVIGWYLPAHYATLAEILFKIGLLSCILGLTNLLPIPALDGSYPIMVWLEKFYGKKRGYALMKKINTISFKLLMALNVLCIPYLVYLAFHGGFRW